MLCGVSAVFFLWFTLACQQYVSNSTLALYFSSVLGGFFLNGSIPLFYELGVETTYPIAEGEVLLDSGFACLVKLFGLCRHHYRIADFA